MRARGSVDRRFEPAGKFLRLAHHEQVVPERQRLKRRERLAADRRVEVRVGAVERLHERVGHAPHVEAIDGPPPHLGIIDLGGVGVVVNRRVVVLEEEELEARPSHAAIERAGDRQDAVADGLGVEPAAILPPEIAVVGIDRIEGRIVARTPGGRRRCRRSAGAEP